MGKENRQYELVVNQGKRPFWMRLLAAIFFTIVICRLYYVALSIYQIGFDDTLAKTLPGNIKAIACCFAGGVYYSITKNILIDTDKDILISRFYVGPFSRDIKSQVPELEYVAVFLDSKGYYQVNLWYVRNRHYQMYVFEEKEPAMKFAKDVTARLHIDLLDATVKNNSVWIDLPDTDSQKSSS